MEALESGECKQVLSLQASVQPTKTHEGTVVADVLKRKNT